MQVCGVCLFQVLIEHDTGVIMDIIDRILVINFGRGIAERPPLQIKSVPKVV